MWAYALVFVANLFPSIFYRCVRGDAIIY